MHVVSKVIAALSPVSYRLSDRFKLPSGPSICMSSLWKRLKSALKNTLWGLIALVLLFEEWGWKSLSAALKRWGQWPPFAVLERGIRQLPPWAAVCVMGVPAVCLLPLKLVALWLFANGHGTVGLLFLITLKVVGTALVARLFQLTEPTLMQIGWFAKYYPRFYNWKEALFTRIRESVAWRWGRRFKAQIKRQWREWRLH